MTMRKSAGRGGAWVAGQIVLMLGTILGGVLARDQWTCPADWWLAGALTVVGAFFGIGGVVALGSNRTVFPEPRAGATLVRSGIYAHVRHPLYTSVMCLSFAWGFWMQSWVAMVGAICTTAFLYLKSIAEEKRLLRRFPKYEDHRRGTKRFLPGIW